MHFPIQNLAFLLVFQSLLACQQQPGIADAQKAYKTVAASIQDPFQPTEAKNIVFKSIDEGQTWEDFSAGLPENLGVSRVVTKDGKVLLVAEDRLFQNSGVEPETIWEVEPFRNTVLNEPFQKISLNDIYPGFTGNFASSYGKGFFKEINRSGLWLPMHQNLHDKTVRSILETENGTLFVGCESGLYKSTDDAKTWKQVVKEEGVNSLALAAGALIMGTYKGLFRSTDLGETWEHVLTQDVGAYNIKQVDGAMIAITDAGRWQDGIRANRLRISKDQGKSWQRIDENLVVPPFMSDSEDEDSKELRISDFAQAGKYLFCCTNAGIFRSTDLGKNWELIRLSSSKEMFRFGVSGKTIYAVQVTGC